MIFDTQIDCRAISMSANSHCDMPDSSIPKSTILSNNPNKMQQASEFYQELNSVLNSKPPISKEKVNKIVREALKSHRHYKHVVYYVENFIKTVTLFLSLIFFKSLSLATKCPADYKLSGLYVIDALIRKHSSNNTSDKKKHQACVDLYTKRFSVNMCKTFTNLFLKSPQSDRCKINRVIELWQKYSVIEHDLIDKLNRISNTSKIDIALSEKSANNSDDKNSTLSNELDKPDTKSGGAKKLKPSASPNKITKTEISKILEFDKDFDSDSDNQSSLKRKSTSPNLFDASNPTSIFQSTADRLQNSISNCTAWLQTNSAKLKTPAEDQSVKLADFVPPLFMSHYSFANAPSQPPPPPPPPAPVPPPPKVETRSNPRERERERQRRGLPPIKDKHLCICSKTIWLGHLSKATNEDIVIDEIIELLSPSSSNDSESMLNKKRSSRSANSQNIIVDVHPLADHVIKVRNQKKILIYGKPIALDNPRSGLGQINIIMVFRIYLKSVLVLQILIVDANLKVAHYRKHETNFKQMYIITRKFLNNCVNIDDSNIFEYLINSIQKI
ncbi:splicing arginine serine-rich 15 isoform X1 [Brachionus plicatilis]|uniref:Splicing arginine serine-rich 15 isoform X1 n=1 Tax=Brachionus plicatilis TaxID=10195 RepID=A0A3M7RVV5_BRAPC|nr:splicing arginine serine-rich 15 isoform X1 [Brachionus plicatilis]